MHLGSNVSKLVLFTCLSVGVLTIFDYGFSALAHQSFDHSEIPNWRHSFVHSAIYIIGFTAAYKLTTPFLDRRQN